MYEFISSPGGFVLAALISYSIACLIHDYFRLKRIRRSEALRNSLKQVVKNDRTEKLIAEANEVRKEKERILGK